MFAAYSGRPFTVFASDSSLNMPGNAQTADQVKDKVEILGNVGDDGTRHERLRARHRRSLRQRRPQHHARAGVVNLDMGLFRTFKVTQGVDMQFRAEAFNVANTPHFAQPNNSVNSSNFGRILETQGDDALGASRQFRFGLRVTF